MSHRDEDDAMNAFDSSPFKLEWTSAGHATEESVYAWLDGALGDTDSDVIERHVHACTECSAAVAEARGFIAASVRIMNAADLSPRNTQRGVVSAEDVVRTAAKIIALADKKSDQTTSMTEQTQTTAKHSSRNWHPQTWARAAAAAVLMATGTYVAMRGHEKKIDSISVAPVSPIVGSGVLTAPPPDASVISKAAPDTVPVTRPILPKRVVANAELFTAAKKQKEVRTDTMRTTKTEASTVAAVPTQTARITDADILPAQGKASSLPMLAGRASGTNIVRAGSTAPTLPNIVTGATAAEQDARRLAFRTTIVAPGDFPPITVSGTVVDRATSAPIAAAIVTVPGTTLMTTTDSAGHFILRDVRLTVDSLAVRRLGYKNATIRIDSIHPATGVARAELDADGIRLEQVIVTSLEGRVAGANMSCLVGVGEASGISVPLVRRLTARMETSTRYAATLSGWPTVIAETHATLTMNTGRVLHGSVKIGGDRLEIELFQQGDDWSGTLREFRGANMRSESIKLTTDKSGANCR